MPTSLSITPKGGPRTDVDPDVSPDLPPPPPGRDLMEIPLVGKIMRSRWYPGVLQVPVAAILVIAAWLLGHRRREISPGALRDRPLALSWLTP